MGGLDTVSTNMGLQMLHLAQHPEDQRFMRENPARIPHAIKEMMRAYAPVTVFGTCTSDVTLQWVERKAGRKVAMMTTLGNREPEEFEEPKANRLARKSMHSAFGFVVH